MRVTIDYRLVNEQVLKSAYPVPLISDIIGKLNGCKFFSNLDIKDAYYCVPIDELGQNVFAWTANNQLYLPTRLPQGYTNAPGAFSHFMHECFQDVEFCHTFIDDILIATETWEKHLEIIEKVFEKLRKYGLPLNLNKSTFGKTELTFLGYKLNREGIQPIPEKVQAIVEFPRPERLKALRRFAGLIAYHMRFIEKGAELDQKDRSTFSNLSGGLGLKCHTNTVATDLESRLSESTKSFGVDELPKVKPLGQSICPPVAQTGTYGHLCPPPICVYTVWVLSVIPPTCVYSVWVLSVSL